MAQWYYGENGVQLGPVDDAQLAALIQGRQVNSSTPVWREGMPTWRSLAEVQASGGMFAAGQASPYHPPASAPYYNPGMAAPTSGMAIASLVCGILGLVTCLLPGVAAVICGHIALKNIADSPTPLVGRGMAIAGLVTGYISVLALLAAAFFFLIVVGSTAAFAP